MEVAAKNLKHLVFWCCDELVQQLIKKGEVSFFFNFFEVGHVIVIVFLLWLVKLPLSALIIKSFNNLLVFLIVGAGLLVTVISTIAHGLDHLVAVGEDLARCIRTPVRLAVVLWVCWHLGRIRNHLLECLAAADVLEQADIARQTLLFAELTLVQKLFQGKLGLIQDFVDPPAGEGPLVATGDSVSSIVAVPTF